MSSEAFKLTIDDIPEYQREAIRWLDGYRNTHVLQELLSRYRFTEAEIRCYRNQWGGWLKPKDQRSNGVH